MQVQTTNHDYVNIVGCGPSAMMIAHACDQFGLPFVMYGPKEPSHISGAQYLHRDVGVRFDGLQPMTVRYEWHGTESGYEKKIYGELPDDLATSWSKFPPEVEAWPLTGIYQHLWAKFEDKIVHTTLTLQEIQKLSEQAMTFSTAPLRSLVPDADYKTERVVILSGLSAVPPFTIRYNGYEFIDYYRTSNLWGYESVEFPLSYLDKYPGLADNPNYRVITKPLSTDATIDNVILSGRYGRWKKGVLVDESYFQAIECFKENL